MGTYRIKRKLFTKYDETDNLKRMKDADILAEKHKRPDTSFTKIATGTLGAATAGGVIGAGIGRIGKGSSWARTGAFAGKGVLAGAAIGTAVGLYRRGQERSANEFYNRRLDYAQRQARRREKADWKANMTQRDGYSY